jgi:hypothetical protein
MSKHNFYSQLKANYITHILTSRLPSSGMEHHVQVMFNT